jgi:signal transduction histidine kinase
MQVPGRPVFTGFLRDITDRQRAYAELRASRQRLVEVHDTERRRLERNLHDGAQQRFVSLAITLRLIRAHMATADDAGDVLDQAEQELALGIEELRELARGIHPAILTERGLGPALTALSARASVPVELAEPRIAERLPEPVEAAAYYLVSEALTNIEKYALASRATVRVVHTDGRLLVEVTDNGVGGADPAKGSGLRGLADRVEALDGRFEVEAAPDGGTRVRAEMPLP